MNIIDIFLSELQKRISANETIIQDFENKKNDLIEINNIFYKYEIINNELDLVKFLSLNSNEAKVLISNLDAKKRDNIYRTYLIYKSLVESYESLSKKYGSSFDAPQYHEAIKWLNELVKRINLFISDFEKRNDEYISKLKEELAFYKKYFNSFSGGILLRPIEDLNEFNNLLDILDFNDREKWQLKKQIGVSLLNIYNASKKKVIIDTSKVEVEINELASSELEKKAKDSLEDEIISEVEHILEEEHELIGQINEKDFNKYLAESINSNDSESIKYQIVSILIALHGELSKYKNTKDIPNANKVYKENIMEYIEVYKTLKNRIE